MKIPSRIGVIVGGFSISFSTVCFFLALGPFTPAFVLAVLVGTLAGAVAMMLRARRTALVAFTFALTPYCGFLTIEYVAERVGTGYVVFIPLGVALVVAAWALIDYSKRATAR